MRHTRHVAFGLLASFVVCLAIGCGDDADLNSQWQLVEDSDGIAVYSKHRTDSRVKTFRGVGTFESEKPLALLNAMSKSDSSPGAAGLATFFLGDNGALDFLVSTEIEILESGLENFLTRVKIDPIWPVQCREFLIAGRVRQDKQMLDAFSRATVLEYQSVGAPQESTNECVPIGGAFGELRLLPVADGEVEVTYEVLFDLGGDVPPSLVERGTREIPRRALERARAAMLNPENQDYDFPELEDPEF